MKTILLIGYCMVFSTIGLKAQVTQLNNNRSLQANIALAGKTIVISQIDSSIWVTDATVGGTVQISTTIKYEGFGGVLGDKLVFTGSTPATGSEVYITDGTNAGTTLVKDILPGTRGSLPGAEGAVLGDYIYFTAETVAEGRELWRTNGTEAGTTLVKDIVPGNTGSNLINEYQLFPAGAYLLFRAQNGAAGIELWRSDGTEGGTVPLLDINPGNPSSNPRTFFGYNNLILFVATDAEHGEEFWKTDGTPGGTVLLKDVSTGPRSSTTAEIFPGFPAPIFQFFHLFNNRVYFNASNGTSNGQLWSTDGTTANTTLLKDIVPGAPFPFVLLINAINLPGKFIFPVSDGANRSELWESDGTPDGTKLFRAFASNDPPGLPLIFLTLSGDSASGLLTYPLFQGNKFFFAAPTIAEGYELWISDGTPAGTSMVKNINSGAADGIDLSELSWVYTANELYFAANDGTNGNELWRSNGTETGTTLVQNINPGPGSSDPDLSFLAFGKIIFTATDGDHPDNTDLFVIDGTFTPLPVEFGSFTAELRGSDALLRWSTLQESNSRDFTIQRSYDGRRFEAIGTVPARGSSSVRHEYAYTDAGVAKGNRSIIYYRLTAGDRDGRSRNSHVISLRLRGGSELDVRLLSNPVRDNVSVMLSGVTGSVQISIIDLNGKPVYKSALQQVNGLLTLPAGNLQGGVYILVAETNSERKTLRFIK